MLRLLDIALQLLKWTFWLTLARLLTTAFGWEFGVSRQYLRLLEWLLARGQARIEKVDSQHRMHLDELDGLLALGESPRGPGAKPADGLDELGHGAAAAAAAERCDQCGDQLAAAEAEKENGDQAAAPAVGSNGIGLAAAPAATRQAGRKVSILRGHFERRALPTSRANGAQWDRFETADLRRKQEVAKQQQQQQQQRRRRISTPDGPPVFLLDEEDEDCERAEPPAATIEEEARRSGHRHEFQLVDAARLVVRGVSAICDDEVTKRFTPEQLKSWNLLTRTNAKNYQFMSRSLGLYWLLGLLIRYGLLMPLRIMFTLAGTLWLVATMTLIGLLVPPSWRDKPFRLMSLMSFRMLSCGITSRLRFHNRQHRARGGDICVANHTSPIDVVLLACDNCYALVGQRHGGLLGLLEMALSRATNHVWFDRDEMRDRQLVGQRLREHVAVKSNLPVLIFPEGTCINNSAVMMFRKGSFETGARICPVAIKYDSRFGDPFWNSSKQSYLEYLLMMMSSWAIKCDVWYLPPMERLAEESSAEFANRVKAEIAKQAGLEDLAWDGQLKRSAVKPTWLFQQQEDYVKRLKLD